MTLRMITIKRVNTLMNIRYLEFDLGEGAIRRLLELVVLFAITLRLKLTRLLIKNQHWIPTNNFLNGRTVNSMRRYTYLGLLSIVLLVHYGLGLFSRLYGFLFYFFDAHLFTSEILFDGAFLKGQMFHLTIIKLFGIVLLQFLLLIFHHQIPSIVGRVILILP